MHWKQYTTLLNHSQQFIEISFPPVDLVNVLFSNQIEIVSALGRYFSRMFGTDKRVIMDKQKVLKGIDATL